MKNEYLSDPTQWGRFFTESAWAGAGLESTNYRPLPDAHARSQPRDGRPAPLRLSPGQSAAAGRPTPCCSSPWDDGWLCRFHRPGSPPRSFAVHPMLSEPVAEIVGRMDLMAGGALLGGLLCHINGRLRGVVRAGLGTMALGCRCALRRGVVEQGARRRLPRGGPCLRSCCGVSGARFGDWGFTSRTPRSPLATWSCDTGCSAACCMGVASHCWSIHSPTRPRSCGSYPLFGSGACISSISCFRWGSLRITPTPKSCPSSRPPLPARSPPGA